MRLVGLGSLGLREGVGGQSLLLGLHDGHVVGQRPLRSNLATGVPGQHNLDLQQREGVTPVSNTREIIIAQVGNV